MRLGQACRELALWVIYSMTPHIKRADCPFGLMRARELSSTFYIGEKGRRCYHPGKYNNKQMVHTVNTILHVIIMTAPRMPECLTSWVGGLDQSQLTDFLLSQRGQLPSPSSQGPQTGPALPSTLQFISLTIKASQSHPSADKCPAHALSFWTRLH